MACGEAGGDCDVNRRVPSRISALPRVASEWTDRRETLPDERRPASAQRLVTDVVQPSLG
eukprot:7381570-Prymnesium_polylepis.2